MNIPENRKYAESHEWIQVEDNIGTVGITDHAQSELGDVVYVEVPKIGKKIKAKEPIAVVESVKAAADVYSPVSGEIIEVNPALEKNPALVNQSPYQQGWMFKIKLADAEELTNLKDAATYQKHIS